MSTPALSDSRRRLHPAFNAPVARSDYRSVHRRVLTAYGSSVSPIHAKLSCSVRRQVLTASGSSVSSLHVRLSCTVHRQVQTPGLACTIRRAMPCCHVVSLCSSVLFPSDGLCLLFSFVLSSCLGCSFFLYPQPPSRLA